MAGGATPHISTATLTALSLVDSIGASHTGHSVKVEVITLPTDRLVAVETGKTLGTIEESEIQARETSAKSAGFSARETLTTDEVVVGALADRGEMGFATGVAGGGGLVEVVLCAEGTLGLGLEGSAKETGGRVHESVSRTAVTVLLGLSVSTGQTGGGEVDESEGLGKTRFAFVKSRKRGAGLALVGN